MLISDLFQCLSLYPGCRARAAGQSTARGTPLRHILRPFSPLSESFRRLPRRFRLLLLLLGLHRDRLTQGQQRTQAHDHEEHEAIELLRVRGRPQRQAGYRAHWLEDAASMPVYGSI